MFGPAYFGPRFYSPTFFGHGGTPTPGDGDYLGSSYFGSSYFGPNYFGTTPGTVTPVVPGPGNPIAAYLFAVRRRHVAAAWSPIATTAEVWDGDSWSSIAWNGAAPTGVLIVLNRRSLLSGRVGTRTSQ